MRGVATQTLTIFLCAAIVWCGLAAHGAGADASPRMQELRKTYVNATFVRLTAEEYLRAYDSLQGRVVLQGDFPPGTDLPGHRSLTSDTRQIILVDTNTVVGVARLSMAEFREAESRLNGRIVIHGHFGGDPLPSQAQDLAPRPDQIIVVDLGAADQVGSGIGGPNSARPPIPPPVHHIRTTQPAADDVYVDGSCINIIDIGDWGGGDGDLAVIIFILAGIVTVVAFVAYTGVYLADMMAGDGHYDYWWDLEQHATWATSDSINGGLYGIKFATGFTDRQIRVGIAGEVGYISARTDFEDLADPVRLNGAYVMAGPAIRWIIGGQENPSYSFVELMAGTTEHKETDMISMARTGVDWGIGEHLRAGLSIGALYMDLELDEGLARDYSDFSLLLGGAVGVRF